MIVFKMVTKEKDGRLVSLMETGNRQIEYKPGEFSYPPVGVLYARDSREAPLEAVRTYISTSIPTAELREAEVLISQGATIAVISKKIGVSDHTYYRWRKEYGGMRVDQARRLKELE